MSAPTKEQVTEKLRKVKGPDLESNVVDLGMVSEIFIADGRVMFSLSVPAEKANDLEPMRQAAEKVVGDIKGVKSVMVAMTAEKKPGSATAGTEPVRPAPSTAQMGSVPPPMQGNAGTGGPVPGRPQEAPKPDKAAVPGINAIIAVASGQGGVGKSTTSVNLALALQANGLRVGVLDADIYGPSMPRLLKISGRPQQVSGRIIKPMEGYGLKVMSMGFLVDEETPMIWRGPMVISALTQMLREVEWGELDVLVVDMPPGTGDAQLTMAQQVPLAGSVIVSTPQDLALIDARKGLNMFRRVEVPVLGIVENMSYFICPNCGEQHEIFGHGGARAEAERIGVPFLGGVPLHMDIRAHSDEGTPIVVAEPEGPHAQIYTDIAAKVMERLEAEREMAAGPAIVFE